MPCESYKDALVSAAAGAVPTRAVRAHLASCAACRAAQAEEQSLLASIDAGLGRIANASGVEVPASLIPSVRARIAQPAAAQTHRVMPALVAAACAALAVLVVAHPFRWSALKSTGAGGTVAASAPNPQRVSRPRENAVGPLRTQVARSGATASRGAAHRAHSRSEARTETDFEVLVSGDQEVLLADYARRWRSHGAVVLAASQASDAPLKPMEVAPIQIDLLDVKPLADEGSR